MIIIYIMRNNLSQLEKYLHSTDNFFSQGVGSVKSYVTNGLDRVRKNIGKAMVPVALALSLVLTSCGAEPTPTSTPTPYRPRPTPTSAIPLQRFIQPTPTPTVTPTLTPTPTVTPTPTPLSLKEGLELRIVNPIYRWVEVKDKIPSLLKEHDDFVAKITDKATWFGQFRDKRTGKYLVETMAASIDAYREDVTRLVGHYPTENEKLLQSIAWKDFGINTTILPVVPDTKSLDSDLTKLKENLLKAIPYGDPNLFDAKPIADIKHLLGQYRPVGQPFRSDFKDEVQRLLLSKLSELTNYTVANVSASPPGVALDVFRILRNRGGEIVEIRSCVVTWPDYCDPTIFSESLFTRRGINLQLQSPTKSVDWTLFDLRANDYGLRTIQFSSIEDRQRAWNDYAQNWFRVDKSEQIGDFTFYRVFWKREPQDRNVYSYVLNDGRYIMFTSMSYTFWDNWTSSMKSDLLTIFNNIRKSE